jgi:hypothetical protein
MPKQSALILALGFIIGTSIIFFGLVSLGNSIVVAGSASKPSPQIDLKIVGDSSGSAAPIGLQLKGDSTRDPVLFLDKSKK